jgi:hypothetical protein
MHTVVSVVDEGSRLIQQQTVAAIASSSPVPEGEVEHGGGVSPVKVAGPKGVLETNPTARREGQRVAERPDGEG